MAEVEVPFTNTNGSGQTGTSNNTPAYLISSPNGPNGHPQNQVVINNSGGGVQNDDFDDGNSTARLFERTRIQVLAVERELVQKKTFTKWINSHLIRSGFHQHKVSDLYIDLRDGRVLLRLLEILSSERLPRPTRGKMRIHCLENVDKALLFLQEQHVHLENIGAHDIVDGNGSLTLGLIWTIILRFQIQIIDEEYLRRTEIPSKFANRNGSSILNGSGSGIGITPGISQGTDSPFSTGQQLYETKEKRSAKDALLLWCQIKTADYQNVNVRNFTTSWRDGLAFNALIHKHRPDLINYQQLSKSNAAHNLNNAFTVADRKLGISRILEPEDVNMETPDEKIIMTYVVAFYHYFSKMKDDQVQSKRIAKVVGSAIQIDKDIKQYESLTSTLFEWIRTTIEQLSDRQFNNSLHGVQQQLTAFNQYLINEKGVKFDEKGNLEVLLFSIQSKIRAQNQRPYLPKEGKLISDINRAWAELEKAEHERELALREELVRQENLEQLAAKFNKKATMREKWLNDSQKLVISDQFGFDLESVEAAFKKQEAIQTDIGAFEERVRNVIDIAKVLEKENYHDIESINARKRNVYMLWNYLLELVKSRRQRLESCYSLQKIFQEMQQLSDYLQDLSQLLQMENYGKHLMGVQDLLQRHKLIDADILLIGEKVQRVSTEASAHCSARSESDKSADAHLKSNPENDSTVISERIRHLHEINEQVIQLSKQREVKLNEALRFWQFMEDMAEEELWINEKVQQLNVPDQSDVEQRQKTFSLKPHIVEDEMNAHRNLQYECVAKQGRQLIEDKNYGHEEISERLACIDEKWAALASLVSAKKKHLQDLNETKQFFMDCEDVDSYLFELSRMLTQSASDDYNLGKDEITVLNLLKKHKDLEEDFNKYKLIVQNVHEQAANLPGLKQMELGDDHDESEENKKRLAGVLEQVQQRLKALDRRYTELADMFKLRKQKLHEQLNYLRLQNDADNVEAWVDEKERFLATLDPTTVTDIEALEVIKHRFDGFEREMNSNAPKVAVVNQLARQLVSSQQKQPTDSLSASTQQLNVDDSIDGASASVCDLSGNQIIQERINQLNTKWSNLRNVVDKKRDDLNSTFGVQTFHIESQETISWIQDKIRVVQSTEKLGNDLSGVMQMQRRLSGLERDMAAIMAKKDQLEKQAQSLEKDHPQESADIKSRLDEITGVWLDLKELLNKREETMGEAAELQKFLRDLDHFSVWLTRTQTAVASSDAPQSLVEAEQMLNQHQTIKEEIDRYVPDYSRMKVYGDRVCNNADASDPQYLFLRERLNALDQGWNKLDQMWRHRQLTLSEDLNLEIFKRDAKQAEQLLVNQEYYLKQIQPAKSLEEAEQMLRKHQDFITSSRANKDKIDGVSQSAKSLSEDMHRDTNVILDRAKDIKKRFNENEKRSVVVLNRLRDSVKYYQFLQDCDELKEWLEFKQIQAHDESYRDTKNIHMKYLRHKGFESEIQANRNRLEELEKQAENLFKHEKADESTASMEDQESSSPEVDDASVEIDHQLRDQIVQEMNKRIGDLNNQWDDLQVTTKQKGEKLFDANRGILFEQSVDSIDIWIKEMERHIQFTTQKPGQPDADGAAPSGANMDLTTTNLLLDKQRDIEAQLLARQKQVEELKQQAALLKETEPEKAQDIDTKRGEIEERFTQIVQPLEEKKKQLQQQKRMFQFLRDCDDELLWIEEKMRMAQSPDVGNSLVQVNMMQRKNDTLQKEVDNHDQRIQQVCQDGENMIQEGHERTEEFQNLIASLLAEWQNLKQAIDERRQRLADSQRVQQYLFDCGEAEAWMGEQELYMMSDAGSTAPLLPEGAHEEEHQQQQAPAESRETSTSKWCKDEQNAQNQLKKHTQLESEVEDHAARISVLGDTCRQLLNSAKPQINEDGTETNVLISGHLADSLSKRQMQIDKLYAGLKDLAQERRLRLEETVKLFMLHRDIDDLEQWIADKVIVADSNELGQDFEHVELLKERFHQFAMDTQQIGQERVNHVSEIANVLIDAGHADSSIIAQWNENLNSAWEDLLELIRTRTQMLQSSWELQKFFSDCKEVLSHIDEKKKCIPDEVGRDAQTVAQLQRRHATFEENDLITLGGKVQQIQEEANKLHNLYAGERAKEIKDKELQVLSEWDNLQAVTNARNRQLTDMNDLYKFFNMSRDLMMWMETQMRQMRNDDKPRDVSGVELLINNHQSLKAEIDARVENFTICLNLGKDLCQRRHPRSNEVKDKCVQLCMERDRIADEWTNRWDLLQLMLEVYQFARDAAVAEQWLIAQEPYLLNEDLGETLDQVEQLIKKHETFEKSINAQEERFNALKKLTTLELKEGHSHSVGKVEEAAEEKDTVSAVVQRPKKQDTSNLERSRMSLYLEEFKTIEEREKDLETIRQQEKLIKDAADLVKHEQELREQQALRQREADVLDVTKALASVGASTIQSQGSPSTQRKEESREEIRYEGVLSRKHEWESVNRKASNRSWDKIYVIINSSNRYEFYKDQKHFKNNKPVESLSLIGAKVEPAVDYKKKEHVFRLKLNNGGQYLFRAKDDDEMQTWISRTLLAIQSANTSGSSLDISKTKSLPPQSKQSSSGPGGVSGSLRREFFKK